MDKIIRSSLSDQIAQHLQEEIMKGTWKPGEKLPSETQLAEMLGVSRMSLRSGIQRCNAIGLTETRVGSGTYVRAFNMRSYFSNIVQMNMFSTNYSEINDVRYMIQIGSVLFALEDGISEKQIKKLEKLNRIMHIAAAHNDIEQFEEADLEFHLAVCHLSDNHLIDAIYDAIEYLLADTTRKNTMHSLDHHSGFDMILHHHNALLDAIRQKNISALITEVSESRKRAAEYYKD